MFMSYDSFYFLFPYRLYYDGTQSLVMNKEQSFKNEYEHQRDTTCHHHHHIDHEQNLKKFHHKMQINQLEVEPHQILRFKTA